MQDSPVNEHDSSSHNEGATNIACDGTTRRDFLTLTASAVGVVGVGAVALPFIKSMNPAADVMAEASIDVNLNDIAEGKSKVVMWRGKPIFIRHRTKEEIERVQKVGLRDLKDPQTDQERFSKNPIWLVVIGVCTHLGCVPNERRGMQAGNANGGWLCACHGSVYDESGRIITGPAPLNLEVPPYQFTNNGAVLRIG
jgi:ubiquinol-cytochrome c reductase iron-sulfur subunit